MIYYDLLLAISHECPANYSLLSSVPTPVLSHRFSLFGRHGRHFNCLSYAAWLLILKVGIISHIFQLRLQNKAPKNWMAKYHPLAGHSCKNPPWKPWSPPESAGEAAWLPPLCGRTVRIDMDGIMGQPQWDNERFWMYHDISWHIMIYHDNSMNIQC